MKKLKEVCTIVAGQSPESKYYNTIGDGIPFFQGKADFGDLYPTVRVYCSQPTKTAEKDDILLSVRAPVGATNLAPCKVCIGRGLTAIRPTNQIELKYLLYYFRFIEKPLQQKGTGTTFKAITQDVIKNLAIPVPPIEEQRRIVSRLEEMFSELDSAVETLQKTRQQLEIYRQAVLKEAFEGISECVTMYTVATMIDPQPSHRTPPVHQGGIPYIGIGDIDYKNYSIIFSEARKVNPNLLDEHKQRYSIDDGDFIMGKIGTIGKPFKLPLPQNYTLSANVILIKPHIKIINPDFLFWQFSSDWVTTQLMSGATATSQPAFGIKKARLLRIKICDYDAQIEIVNSINSKMSECDNINKTVAKSLQQAEAMRQSILKKAFEGEL